MYFFVYSIKHMHELKKVAKINITKTLRETECLYKSKFIKINNKLCQHHLPL